MSTIKKKTTAANVAEKSAQKTPEFEDALRELEEITRSLESGQLSLNESIKAYERGMELRKTALITLEAAEKKLEYLEKKSDGTVEKKVIPAKSQDLFASDDSDEDEDDDSDDVPF
jgi:exodeoxyribonuclease VII small subunit